jgi:hypothetical protein
MKLMFLSVEYRKNDHFKATEPCIFGACLVNQKLNMLIQQPMAAKYGRFKNLACTALNQKVKFILTQPPTARNLVTLMHAH